MTTSFRRRALIGATLAATFLGSRTLSAQAAPAGPYAKDVASADAIISALYDVISGPAGQKRDWARFKALFIPMPGSSSRERSPIRADESFRAS